MKNKLIKILSAALICMSFSSFPAMAQSTLTLNDIIEKSDQQKEDNEENHVRRARSLAEAISSLDVLAYGIDINGKADGWKGFLYFMELTIGQNNYNKTLSNIYNQSNRLNNTVKANDNFQNKFNKIKNNINPTNIYNRNLSQSINYLKDKDITDPKKIERLKELDEIYINQDSKDNSIYSIDMIKNVMKLEIDENKDKYYNIDGKLNIEKVFNACGTSLDSCTPRESLGIFSELKEEGLIDRNQYNSVSNTVFVWIGQNTANTNGNVNAAFNMRGSFKEYLQSVLEHNKFGEYHDMLLDVINLIR